MKKLPKLYYDAGAGGYWLQIDSGRYLKLDKADALMHLIDAGLDDHDEFVNGMKKITRCYLVAQKERCVDYAGPLSGYRQGTFETPAGLHILVTRSFQFLEGKEGKIKHFEKFITELLPGEQWKRFACWLKLARRNLKRGVIAPAQAMVLAGPGGCGKSFLQILTTHLLGGRVAQPYQYMIGESGFNKDLAEAEHWMIEDEFPSTAIAARRKFGSALKQATVNSSLRVHPKGRDAIVLDTARWVTITINSEKENLAMLPPLDESIVDKITMLSCQRAEMIEDRAKNWEQFKSELPAIAHFIDSLEIPKSWKHYRMGVREWHHPDLVSQVNELAPEHKLIELIDEVIDWQRLETPHAVYGPGFHGSANELESMLRRSDHGFQADKIFGNWSAACGTFLGRIQKTMQDRIWQTHSQGRTTWHIKPPPPAPAKLEV